MALMSLPAQIQRAGPNMDRTTPFPRESVYTTGPPPHDDLSTIQKLIVSWLKSATPECLRASLGGVVADP